MSPSPSEQDGIRLDKWLWAARFFKTRTLAAEAVGGGKVDVDGKRAKRSTIVQVGDRIRIRSGPYEHRITVRGVSDRRGPASEAQALYEEDAASRTAREELAARMRLEREIFTPPKGRPTKKDRREIARWKDRHEEP